MRDEFLSAKLQCIALPWQLPRFPHDADELFFFDLSEPSMLSGVRGQSLDIADALFVTPLGSAKRGLSTPLRFARLVDQYRHAR